MLNKKTKKFNNYAEYGVSHTRESAHFAHQAKKRHCETSEKSIEKYLVERAGERGWPCLKYSNPNMVGYPDRLLVLPGGRVLWVELKSRGRKPTKIQLARHSELAAIGHAVEVIDNKADIDRLLNSVA